MELFMYNNLNNENIQPTINKSRIGLIIFHFASAIPAIVLLIIDIGALIKPTINQSSFIEIQIIYILSILFSISSGLLALKNKLEKLHLITFAFSIIVLFYVLMNALFIYGGMPHQH
jgi:hypothetical protein